MLRWLTAGESHGPALVAVLEGLPAGVQVTTADLAGALARRRLGYGRGARMRFERDEVEVLGGVRHGVTIGSPVAIRIGNSEWAKWRTVMSPDPVDPADYAAADDVNAEREIARNQALTRPRPGHADLVGMQKYGFTDARPVLERASARETAARVALGEVAARLLAQAYGIRLVSHTVAIGTAGGLVADLPTPDDAAALDADSVRAFDAAASAAMVAEVEAAKKDGDTLGGVVEVLAYGVPPGLGSYVHWDRRLDAQLAAALMGIQAIKGVQVGDGFEGATRRGSSAHDEMERDGDGRIRRRTGRAGGTEGGMSTGEVL
ncbi:MAG TPA: chorismate synthase, partial [Candidatus Lustribacter sp.]|nr:chorismate synthase [Candidatus Lustribacter sp.]